MLPEILTWDLSNTKQERYKLNRDVLSVSINRPPMGDKPIAESNTEMCLYAFWGLELAISERSKKCARGHRGRQ
jgi:hypothetical protein